MNVKPASNNQLKQWRKLLMGKYRKRENKFLAEGIRCVEQILHHKKVNIDALIITESAYEAAEEMNPQVPVYQLSNRDFASISDTETPQGMIAICNTPEESNLSEIRSLNKGLIAAFDAIQDPGNLGTMIRTASWFGVDALLFGDGCVDPFHPKVVRSTAGATGVVSYVKGNLETLFTDLETNGWTTCLLDGSASSGNLHNQRFSQKSILTVGNEGNGINPALFKSHRHKIKIDGNSDYVESLNAAVAFSISLFSAQANN